MRIDFVKPHKFELKGHRLGGLNISIKSEVISTKVGRMCKFSMYKYGDCFVPRNGGW